MAQTHDSNSNRMHSQIADFPSKTLYHSSLISHASVASHLLRDLPGVAQDDDSMDVVGLPIVFFDTSGCEYYERLDVGSVKGDEGSKCNENEATLVKNWVERLVSVLSFVGVVKC
jgi:DNA polymerase alpha-associated DNA helicase A